MHRLLQAIPQFTQIATAHGQPRRRPRSPQIQMHHMPESLQIQTSLKGKKNQIIAVSTLYYHDHLCRSTSEFTPEKNHSNVGIAANVSPTRGRILRTPRVKSVW